MLRDELIPFRQALAGFQAEHEVGVYQGALGPLLLGTAASRGSRLDVDGKFLDAVLALKNVTMPLPPQLLLLRPVFDVLEAPVKAVKHAVTGDFLAAGREVTDAILQAAEVKEKVDSGGFLEVHHHLGWTLNEWFKEADERLD
jgi:hypothetical protein